MMSNWTKSERRENPGTTDGPGPFRFAILLLPRFSMISLLCAIEPLRIANYLSPSDTYSWHFLSDSGETVTASNGMELRALPFAPCPPHECLMVCASYTPERFTRPGTLAALRREMRHGGMLASLENGSYLLAEAGILHGRKATSHWNSLGHYRTKFPNVDFVAQLYTDSDRLMTCSGGLSATDMMLHFLERRHGAAFAARVGNQLLVSQGRPPEAPQSTLVGLRGEELSSSVARACQAMSGKRAPRTVEEIAADLGLSRRHLDRLFSRELGSTAKRFFLTMRLDKARRMVRQTVMPLQEVALICGFSTYAAFSISYRRRFGLSPRMDRLERRREA